MSNYPDKVDVFNEKLNKSNTVYVIEEEVTVSGGKYEAPLRHDNIVDSSVRVYTGTKLTGERIDNFILSIPDGMRWKRIIKIFTASEKVYISYETTGDQVEAEDINKLQESMTATQIEVDRYKQVNDLAVQNTISRVITLENIKADKTYVDGELLKKADKVNTYTKTETDARIQNVVGAAPAALDTLQELGAALNNDPNFAVTITNELSKKVEKVTGKQLSTEDYTTPEKTKLAGIETGANKYVHPTTHPASIIVQDANYRFVTDAEKSNWNEMRPTKSLNASTVDPNVEISHEFVTKHLNMGDGGVDYWYVSNMFMGTATTVRAQTANRYYSAKGASFKVRFMYQNTWSAWTEDIAEIMSRLTTHINDSERHVTDAERESWNAKSNLALGEGASTAYRGDRGKTAYDHSQIAHAPANAQKNSDITKAEIEAKLTGDVTTHTHGQYVTISELGNAGYGDMLKSVYDTNGNGIVDMAESVAWSGITGKPSTFSPSAHTHDLLSVKPDNYKDGLSLPSTYDRGQTMFFSNNPTNKFNGVSYCTIVTIKGYSNMACTQFIYPYNVDAPILFRHSLYNSDAWKEWRSFETKGAKTWNDLKGV